MTRLPGGVKWSAWIARSLVLVVGVTGPLAAGGASADAGDSSRTRWEVGVLSDVTNELFMQDTYSDTTFLSRKLVGSPEYRSGAVASLDWYRELHEGSAQLTVRPEFILGAKLTHIAVSSSLKRPTLDRWSWSIEPSAQAEFDRSFGIDRREVGAAMLGRARREMGWARDQAIEVRAAGDLLEVLANSKGYSLSHRTAHVGVAFDRSGLAPVEFHAEARSYVRTFPDSTLRDHLEQMLQAAVSRDFGGMQTVSLGAAVNVRSALHETASSRDRFALYESQADWVVRLGLRHSIQVQADVERTRFAEPDSVLDFDYDVLRVSSRWTWQIGNANHVSAGTRWEWLEAPWNPVERYREGALTMELERFTLGSWVVLSPALLWRRYEVTSAGSGFDLQLAHSHFDGVEVFTMLEQAIPGGLRIRSTGIGRIEWHRASSDDSRSLYFSLDVRRLF